MTPASVRCLNRLMSLTLPKAMTNPAAVTDKASEVTDKAAEKATGYWNQLKGAFDEGKDGK